MFQAATTMSRYCCGLISGVMLCVVSTQLINATDCKDERVSDDILIRFGDEIVLDCMINVTCRGVNSSSLFFTKNDIQEEYSNILEAILQHVSSKQLQLRIPNVTTQNSGKYSCQLDNGNNIILLGATNVTVDYLPQLPTGFHCISNNQRNMTCTFDYPIKHKAETKFNIFYTITSRKSNCPAYEGSTYDLFPRNSYFEVKLKSDKIEVSCGFPEFKKYKRYCFVFKVVHKFGTNTTLPYTVYTGDTIIVKPDPVRELKIEALDSYTLQVSWQPPNGIDGLIKQHGLDYELVYYSNWDPGYNMTQIINRSFTISYENKKIVANLTGLLPHTKYTVIIKTKPSTGDYWSEPNAKSAKTSSAVPKHSPVIPPGGFRIIDCNSCTKIRLYWQSIEHKDQYGDMKAYVIVYNGTNHSVPYNTDVFYQDINIDDKHAQTIELYARNDAGISRVATQFNVTDFDKLPGYPTNFAVKPSLNETTVTITWNPPVSNPHGYVYKRYVIYICKKAGVHQDCANSLQYLHINASYSSVQVNVLEQYGFEVAADAKIGIAIAATRNGITTYSGILWQCLYDSRSGEKAPNINVEYGIDLANVTFEPLSCKYSRTRVKHYEVFYCEADTCSNTTEYRNVSNWGVEGYVSVNDLVPLTEYKYWVVAVTALGPGIVTPEDRRKTFKTLGLIFSASIDEKDPGKITFNVPNYKKNKSVWAIWTDSNRNIVRKQRCIRISDSSGTMNIDCRNKVNGSEVSFAVYQGHCDINENSRRLSASKTVEVCRARPLPSEVIAVIVIAAATVGVILFILGYHFRKAVMKELQRCKDFGIKMPTADNRPIRRQEHHDYQNYIDPYSQGNVDNPNSQSATDNLILQKSYDSGRGSVSSTSSATANLVTPMSDNPSDVFADSPTDRDSGQQCYLHYITNIARSDSYVDNEALNNSSNNQSFIQEYNSMTKDDSSGLQMESILPQKEEPLKEPKMQKPTVNIFEYPHLKEPAGDKPILNLCPPHSYSQFAIQSKGINLSQNMLEGKGDSGYISPTYQDSYTFSSKDIPSTCILDNKKTTSENNLHTNVISPENIPLDIVLNNNGYVCVPENLNKYNEDIDFDNSLVDELSMTKL